MWKVRRFYDGHQGQHMTASPRPAASRILVDNLANWLMQEALAERDLEPVVTNCCERLQAAGIPLARAFFAFAVLHPLHSAIGITWTRGNGVSVEDYPHVPGGISDQFRRSPHFYMIEHKLDVMRIRLESSDGPKEFPIIQDLKADGMTDYLAFTIDFLMLGGRGMMGSWSTDAEDGFSEGDIEHLLRIQRRLAVAAKVAIQARLMRNLANTYLGPITGSYVLEGQIKRGDGQSIEAAVWLSDLRNSTVLAANLPRQEYIDTLNGYFDITGGAVQAAGGEILDFIGDGLLAIFPIRESHDSVGDSCRRALSAAHDALLRKDRHNEERRAAGLAPLEFGVGLHVGEVMYGNVGVPERLTFSAFGVVLHEVDRLEKLSKDLGEAVLASGTFVEAAGQGSWRDLGTHHLRGVGCPVNVQALIPA